MVLGSLGCEGVQRLPVSGLVLNSQLLSCDACTGDTAMEPSYQEQAFPPRQPSHPNTPQRGCLALVPKYDLLGSSDLTLYGLLSSLAQALPPSRANHLISPGSPTGPLPAPWLSLDGDVAASPLAFSLSLNAVAVKTTETGTKTSTTAVMPPDPWPAGCPTLAASETRYL